MNGSHFRRVAGAQAIFEQLEPRLLLSVTGLLPENVEQNLAAYYELLQASEPEALDTVTNPQESALVAQAGNLSASAGTWSEPVSPPATLLQLDQTGRPLVDIWTRGPAAPVAAQLGELDADVLGTDETYHLVEAWLDAADLPVVATMDGVLSLTPVYRPIMRAGSVMSEGDAVVHADGVRALGYDGSPFLVGVLSDSALNIGNSQTTGDLPAVVDRYLEFAARDEGRAMLEIVYDVAPGAALAHHSGILSEDSMAQGIRELAAAGAKVICDDLLYPTEPFFQDGIIAQAVNDVTAAGVTYVSAAGNDRDQSYEGTYVDAGGYHDFDPSAGVDPRQQVTVPVGCSVVLDLQWDDPFTETGVTHDYDVNIYDSAGNLVVTSAPNNNIDIKKPWEIVSWDGSGDGIYQVEIQRAAGSSPSLLKYILITNGPAATIDEYATHSGTVVGHAAAANAIAVGAVPYYDPSTIESFSSWGNATIYFDPAGNLLPTPDVRLKPDVVGPDRVSTTVPGFTPFNGTSAAAPHVAAVAALILDVNPHLTREELYQALTSTQMGVSGPEQPAHDRVWGYGLVNADYARQVAEATADVTAPSAVMVSPGAVSGWDVQFITVQFSEPMDPATATNTANYTLVEAGPDAVFDTPDDVAYTVNVSYPSNPAADPRKAIDATLTFTAPNTTLSDGQYRLTLHAVNLTDSSPAHNPLNGGVDQIIPFIVAPKSDVVTLEGGTQLDVRPDGTALLAYPANPLDTGSHYHGPQVFFGQYDRSGARKAHTNPPRSTLLM